MAVLVIQRNIIMISIAMVRIRSWLSIVMIIVAILSIM